MCKVSVIIPVYKTEKYLRQCVDSVLMQPYQNIEVVLVDDGSPDTCPQICDEYARLDVRVKVVHKENGGSSDARNAGIRVASGDYLMFLDSDDFWTEDIELNSLIECLDKQYNYDFLLFGVKNFYQVSNKVVKSIPHPPTVIEQNVHKIEKLKALQRIGSFPMSPCDKIIRRKFLIENSLYFRKGYTAEDILWFFQMVSCANNFGAVNVYYYVYRKEVEGAITGSLRTIESLMKVVFELADEYREQNTEFANIVLGYMAYEYLILLAYIDLFPSDVQAKFYSYVWVLKYDDNRKVKWVNKLINIVGYKIVSCLFRLYLRRVKKINI